MPVVWVPGAPREGYVKVTHTSEVMALPLLAGSFVYQPGMVGQRGVLYRVYKPFVPTKLAKADVIDGHPHLKAAELLEVKGRGQRFELVLKQYTGDGNGGSFGPSGRLTPWVQAARYVWVVDHLVTVSAPSTEGTRRPGGKGVASEEMAAPLCSGSKRPPVRSGIGTIQPAFNLLP